MSSALCAAAASGDVGAVQCLLDQNTDPGVGAAENGDTPLMAAARTGRVDVAQQLLSHGAEVNTRNATNAATALFVASHEGHVKVARLLLERSADPNKTTTSIGTNALYMASHNNHVEVARVLLEHHANPNTGTTDMHGYTALYTASKLGLVEVARLLLEHKADPNIATRSSGTTALYAASRNNHAEVVRLLLEHSADGAAALYMASQKGLVEVARLLLEHKVDPNAATHSHGITALHIASQEGHMHVVQLLAVHGADVSYIDNYGKNAQRDADIGGHHQLAVWLTAVADHTPIQIATACRLHADGRSAMRTGVMGDPTTCTAKKVAQAATTTTLWGAGLVMPPVCTATTQFARAAMACWSPERHWLFHGQFREAIRSVLHVKERLHRRAGTGDVGAGTHGNSVLYPHLPMELWFLLCSMLLRRNWPRSCHK